MRSNGVLYYCTNQKYFLRMKYGRVVFGLLRKLVDILATIIAPLFRTSTPNMQAIVSLDFFSTL